MMMIPSNNLGNPQTKGFSLIGTLIILLLAAVLVVFLLTLVGLEERTSGTFEVHEQAQANAIFAMDLALAELQESAGPDQRITASAAIFDEDTSTEDPDGIEHPYWTGVWYSWDTWLNAGSSNPKTGKVETIADTYTPGRVSRFHRWLVSGLNPAATDNPSAAKAGSTPFGEGVDAITLVGSGSLGLGAEADKKVVAGLITIPRKPSDAEQKIGGRAAWWVGDEGTKARVDLASPFLDPNDASSASLQFTDALRNAPEAMAGLGDLSQVLEDDPDIPRRFLTRESIVLALDESDQELALQSMRRSFHSVTDVGSGILTDARSSGLKKDLSLLLESNSLPAPYFGISPSITPPIRPYEELPGSLYPPNFQSWYSLQQFYQLYRISESWNPPPDPRSDGNYLAYSNNPSHPDVDGGVFWSEGRPEIDYYLRNGVNEVGSYRHWVVSKIDGAIYIQREQVPDSDTSRYFIIYNPVITLWNPYNVRLRIPPIHYQNDRTPMEVKLFVDGTAVGNWAKPPGYHKNIYFRNTYGPVGSPDRTWIELEPGETRVFSTLPVRAEVGVHVEVYPGYNAGEGGWRAPLFGGAPQEDSKKVEIAMRLTSAARIDGGTLFPNTRPHEYSPGANPWQLNYIPFAEDVEIISEEDGERAEFPNRNDDRRRPVALIRLTLKSGQQVDAGDIEYPDYRNRFLIHANPSTHRPALNSPLPRFRAAAQYDVLGIRIRGELDRNLPQVAPNNRAGYVGSGFDASEGQERWTFAEIPTQPLTSLGQLQHMRLEPGTRRWDSRTISTIPSSHLWDVSANQGYGFANSFAHPLIAGNAVYQEDGDNRRDRSGVLQYDRLADTWDNSFLTNDALFDSWFFSGIAPRDTDAFPEESRKGMREILSNFFTGNDLLPNSRFAPLSSSTSDSDTLTNRYVDPSGTPISDGHDHVAQHLVVKGAFNVNSTEVEAWRLLLHGLKGRAFSYLPSSGTGRSIANRPELALSRFSLPNSDQEALGPYDQAAWEGVRYLTDEQIDRLAKEIVKQVKTRGPFLNMSDFVNRRLANDETGLHGALQAAIDWDELKGATPDPDDPESINGRFKHSTDMIALEDVAGFNYSFPEAGTGSRWAGAPGYVIQGDLLTSLAPILSPRSDTFRIRAYGEVLSPTGEVRGRAWCEAIVQRFPGYVMSDESVDSNPENGNHPEEPAYLSNGAENPAFHSLNQRLGRRFKIIRFRWLSADEI